MVLRALHLCSGYAGFELALRLAGIPTRTVAHVERDAYAAATLVARMEEAHLDRAPVWSDLTTFDGGAFRGRVDLVTAGFPCQPFSSAGQRRGVGDDRWLWPAIWQLVCDVGPRLLFLENVPQLVRYGLPHVLADLAEGGWDAEWGLLSASAVGAPHRRERFWLLAHAPGVGGVPGNGPGTGGPHGWPVADAGDGLMADADGDGWGGQRVPVGRAIDGTEAGRRCVDVGHSGGPRRPEITGGAHGDEAACPRSRSGCGDHVADGPGEGLADPDGGRHERIEWEPRHDRHTRHDADRRGLPAPWPPGRDDRDGWARYLAEGGPEPAVRRGADGRPTELADALHLGGNGLVPAVAAHAFVVLADRLGIDVMETAS